MLRVSRVLAILAVCLTAGVTLPRHANALWGRDGLRIVAGDAQSVVACADGSGGVFAFWSSWPGDIRAIRFLADGSVAAGWPAAGLVVAAHDLGTCFWDGPYAASPDGLGGALVTFGKNCFGGTSFRYFGRVGPNGTIPAGWPTSFDTGTPSVYLAGASDGAGGVYAAWLERITSGDEPFYVQRLNPDGTPAWPKKLLGLANFSFPPFVVDDGAGGAIVAWSCQAVGLGPGGEDLWSVSLPLCGSAVTPVATPDGEGVAFVAWSNGSNTRVIRLVGGDPSPGWPSDGVSAGDRTTDVGTFPEFRVTPDLQGGVFVTWTGPFSERRAQHVTPDGHIADNWLSFGGPRHGRLVPDAQGGWYDVWSENKTGQSGGVDLFALHYDYNMFLYPGWTGNGNPISLRPGSPQGGVVAVMDGLGGFFAVWPDTGIYGQHVAANEAPPLAVGPATTPPRLALTAAPNPVRGTLRCLIASPSPETARLEVFDLAGRRVASRSLDVVEPGAHTVSVDTRRLRPGVYSILLTQASGSVAARFVVAH